MTVRELIKDLQSVPQDAEVYVEGSPEIGVSIEGYDKDGNPKKGYAQIVRLFKPWDVDFVCPAKELAEKEKENDKADASVHSRE